MATVTLRPSADHTAQWVDSTGGSHYTDVSDDSDDTCVRGENNQIDLYHFSNSGISSGVINSVTFYFRGARTFSSTIQYLLYDVGGTYDSLTNTAIWNDVVGGKSTNTWTPAVSWTWAYVDAIRCGAKAITADNFFLYDVWVVVDYTPQGGLFTFHG